MSSDASAPDNDYVSRPGQSEIPVEKDSDTVETGVNPETENSDAQLEKDDKEAINQDNIIEERTRGASSKGQYTEPGDEEGLPTDDGTSSGAAQ